MAQADNRAYDYCECETSGDNNKRLSKHVCMYLHCDHCCLMKGVCCPLFKVLDQILPHLEEVNVSHLFQ